MRKRRAPFRRRGAALLRLLCLFASVVAVPAISHAAITGSITGIVSAAKVDAEGEPLVDPASGSLIPGAPQGGVNISLAPGGRTAVTDRARRYTISGVQPGVYTVRADLVTFGVKDVSVIVTQDLPSRADIVLTKTPGHTEGAVDPEEVSAGVTATHTRLSSGREQLVKTSPFEIYQLNGLMFGAPGVTPDPQGYPHIRGGDFNQIGYQRDGIDITDPLTGAFGTNLVTVGLKNANLYTGGTSAAYGGKTAGFINEVTYEDRRLKTLI